MNEPDIAWAYALKSERLWHGRPGERILLRTGPIPRRAAAGRAKAGSFYSFPKISPTTS